MKIKLLAMSMFLTLPMMANAAYCDNRCDSSGDDNGWGNSFQDYGYFGIKAGSGQYKSPGSVVASNSDGVTYGYRASHLFGMEIEYAYLGTYRDAVSAGHATAVSIAGLHYFNLTDNLAVVGKLGVARTTTQNLPARGGGNTNVMYGVGLDWQASCDVGIRLEIDKYTLKMPATTTATNAYLGFNFSF